MVLYLEQSVPEIAENRDLIVEKIVQFSLTDMLLFWGQEKDLIVKQEELWGPLLMWAKDVFQEDIKPTHTLNVCDATATSGGRLRIFLQKLSDKELAAFYLATLNMRSVLLAAALVKGVINADQAFQAAYIEELYQAEIWGADDEAEAKRQEMKKELIEIEKFLKS